MSDGRIGNSNQFLQISGVVGAPAYSFASDNDSGMYRIGANNIGFSVNGTKILDVGTTGLNVTGNLRLYGSTSGYVGLAPAAIAGSTTYTLPAADGTSGQFLSTNGSGTLSWASSAAAGVSSFSAGTTGLTPSTGTTGAVTLAGTLAIANGGTGSTSAANARTALSVPSTTGSGASGSWGISVTGSAASVVTASFSIVESGGYLYIKYGSTNIARIDSSGNFIALGNSTAYGSI